MPEFGVAPSARFIAIAPQFVVPDVVRSAEYYRDVLGFEILGYLGEPPRFAMLSRDNVEVHLGQGSDGEPPRSNAARRKYGVDAYIWVEDVDTLAAELKKRGARILDGPVERPYGLRELLIEDPDGLRIAFGTHPDSES
jgi:catechol 2,3-dioxygenase-like lactoylglutathione lyase family enzyme